MEQRFLGGTGVPVRELCLGTMMFGAWGNEDREESIRIIHCALDSGINFIDTADVYSCGREPTHFGPGTSPERCEGCIPQTGPGSFIQEQIVANLRRLRLDAWARSPSGPR